MCSKRIDLSGQRFGKWVVLEYSHTDSMAYWTCQCDCGTIAKVVGRSLRCGNSKSCGCYRAESARKVRTIHHKFIDGIEAKRCSTCKNWKALDEFTKVIEHWDGLKSCCRQCDADKRKLRPRNKKYFRDWANNRYATDINFRIKSSIQARIRGAVKNNYKSASTTGLLGCTIQELKQYLGSLFVDDMSWNNYGSWHIDHIKPCASFDLSKPEQQMRCFHYTNLQPLWMIDNVRKKDKIL